ncbi:MAG: hypothetical protein UR28_C0017G0020 [Candidatus Peregrinibacteria bacterium GW2011_GWF2_33_10]|nr:MAG: hypothetical protein UR28_C0017G0020 [Candidatus Peregrinibacteria bacterium GW2011_GWF2_33_10]
MIPNLAHCTNSQDGSNNYFHGLEIFNGLSETEQKLLLTLQ